MHILGLETTKVCVPTKMKRDIENTSVPTIYVSLSLGGVRTPLIIIFFMADPNSLDGGIQLGPIPSHAFTGRTPR
jgi:hypothetical protein